MTNAQGTTPERNPRLPEKNHQDWVAALRRLGGGSPGSEENLCLAEMFRPVHFPISREEVLRRLAAKAEMRMREGITVDLRHAVEACSLHNFRNLNDLIDCVKGELRRMEFAEPHQA